MNYKHGFIDTIGNTPLIRLENIEKEYQLKSKLFVKLERSNPSGSIKDRAAKAMILSALKEGKIHPNTTVIEPTSGNMGISLCAICASLSLKAMIFMPANMSKERILMMKALGAEIVLTDASLGMSGAIKACQEYQKTHKDTFMPSQFENFNNNRAHYETTGPEIYEQTDGLIDIFIASFGTGGTLSGTAQYLKEKNNQIMTIGVEPKSSPFISENKKGPHMIQGIGAGFQPDILTLSYIDKIMTVTDEEAYKYTRVLAKKEGLFCGISSGANLWIAIKLAQEFIDKNIVTILPDNGERYLSVSNLFDEE